MRPVEGCCAAGVQERKVHTHIHDEKRGQPYRDYIPARFPLGPLVIADSLRLEKEKKKLSLAYVRMNMEKPRRAYWAALKSNKINNLILLYIYLYLMKVYTSSFFLLSSQFETKKKKTTRVI